MIRPADARAVGYRIANIAEAYERGDLRAMRALAQEFLVFCSNVAETADGDDDLIRRLVDLGATAAHLIVITEGRDAL